MAQQSDNNFAQQMRKATRDIHKISDTLVNAKLAFALSDDGVWVEGLLIFYEIFKFLEEHVPQDILPVEFHRKVAFEKDLSHYLGPGWNRNYEPRIEVQEYIEHLREIHEKQSILLLAYVYHLYMGLLSGGQILQKKRFIARKINPLTSDDNTDATTSPAGSNITYFDGTPVSELKEKMRNLINEKAKDFDDETKKLLLEESRKVFEMNNKIVRTVQGVNQVNFRKAMTFMLVVIVATILYKYLF